MTPSETIYTILFINNSSESMNKPSKLPANVSAIVSIEDAKKLDPKITVPIRLYKDGKAKDFFQIYNPSKPMPNGFKVAAWEELFATLERRPNTYLCRLVLPKKANVENWDGKYLNPSGTLKILKISPEGELYHRTKKVKEEPQAVTA